MEAVKKKGNGKVTSIAWKINLMHVWHLFGKYFAMDMLVCFLGLAVFVYGMDVQQTGQFSFEYSRKLISAESLKGMVYQVYSVDKGLLYQQMIGPWLYWIRIAGILVLITQALDIFSLLRSGTRRVQKKLKPLDEIADKARELKNLVIDENKYRNLEDAIANLQVDTMETGVHTNNKELRGIENALNDLLERIRVSYRQQTQFVSDASHELRTPIAVIQGYVNMLDRWGKEDETVLAEAISAIQNESGHMQKLVEQLLFLARSDSDRQNLDMKKQELGEILEEIYEESCMIDESHVYTLHKREQAQLCGDFDMLKQSIRILVDNAAKYTAEGEEIILRVGMTKDHLPYYEIQDNGIGMSQKDLERAFDRFYRADAVRSSQTGGTGLGLSIARWITERHQGRYEIISMEGIGTRFHVEFPEWSTAHESSLREVQCAGNAPDGA